MENIIMKKQIVLGFMLILSTKLQTINAELNNGLNKEEEIQTSARNSQLKTWQWVLNNTQKSIMGPNAATLKQYLNLVLTRNTTAQKNQETHKQTQDIIDFYNQHYSRELEKLVNKLMDQGMVNLRSPLASLVGLLMQAQENAASAINSLNKASQFADENNKTLGTLINQANLLQQETMKLYNTQQETLTQSNTHEKQNFGDPVVMTAPTKEKRKYVLPDIEEH